MIEILKAILLGLVQGITEWLPISSTGHMLLVDEIIQLNVFEDIIMNANFVNMFMVVIQFGSILAVCLLYFNRLNPFSTKKTKEEQKSTLSLWLKVIVGVIPAGIIGVLFDDVIETYLYGPLVIAITLIFYGILFIIIENKEKKVKINSFEELTYKTAFFIGCFQVLALIPGTSRSGATILGAVLLGTSRVVAAEFSFFLAVPVMAGASLLKLITLDVVMSAQAWTVFIVGITVAFLVSVFAIKFLLDYIRRHDFKIFGIYRIVLGILVIISLVI